jgi:hypothetical protein
VHYLIKKALANQNFYLHFIAVIAEIELLWCSASTKLSKANNPSYLYYRADYNVVEKHERRLVKEIKEIMKEL